jgi:hypothetical protein
MKVLGGGFPVMDVVKLIIYREEILDDRLQMKGLRDYYISKKVLVGPQIDQAQGIINIICELYIILIHWMGRSKGNNLASAG